MASAVISYVLWLPLGNSVPNSRENTTTSSAKRAMTPSLAHHYHHARRVGHVLQFLSQATPPTTNAKAGKHDREGRHSAPSATSKATAGDWSAAAPPPSATSKPTAGVRLLRPVRELEGRRWIQADSPHPRPPRLLRESTPSVLFFH